MVVVENKTTMSLLQYALRHSSDFETQTRTLFDGVCSPYFDFVFARVRTMVEMAIDQSLEKGSSCSTTAVMFSFPLAPSDVEGIIRMILKDRTVDVEQANKVACATRALVSAWRFQESDSSRTRWLKLFRDHILKKLQDDLLRTEKAKCGFAVETANTTIRNTHRGIPSRTIRICGHHVTWHTGSPPRTWPGYQYLAVGIGDATISFWVCANWGESSVDWEEGATALIALPYIAAKASPSEPKKRAADADAEKSEKKVKQEVPPMPDGAKVVKEEPV